MWILIDGKQIERDSRSESKKTKSMSVQFLLLIIEKAFCYDGADQIFQPMNYGGDLLNAETQYRFS